MTRLDGGGLTVVVMSALLALPAVAAAQDAQEEAELKKLGAYTLTVANVQKVRAALDEFSKQKEEPPAKGEGETVDAAVKEIEGNPKVMAVLGKAGIGARDFMMTLTAVIAVSFMMETAPDSLPAYLQRHAKFIADNEKDVAPLVKMLFGG